MDATGEGLDKAMDATGNALERAGESMSGDD
jgi:hypothetical protein